MKTYIHLKQSLGRFGAITSAAGSITANLILLLLLLGVSVSTAATGTPPEGISYQGYLTDADGNALASSAPENYAIKFRLYDAEENGAIVWSEEQTVTVDNGSFSVLLGEGSAISGDSATYTNLVEAFTAPDASERFVEITVGTGSAIEPRLRLVTSPYAFLATKATSLGDGNIDAISFDGSTLSVSTNATIAGTITVSDNSSLANVTVSGTLGVDGVSTFSSAMTVTDTLGVDGVSTFSSAMTVTDKVTVDELESKGAATMVTLGVSGLATLSDDLVVRGTQNSGLENPGIVEIHEGDTKVLRLDGDEIQSITPGSGGVDTVRKLHLNHDGGDIAMGNIGYTTTIRNPVVLNTTEQLFSDDGSSGSVANVTHNMSRQLVFESLSSGRWALGTEREDDASDEDFYFAYWNGTEWRGKGRVDVSGDFVNLSDRRAKQDIGPMEPGVLNNLMSLVPVRYRLKGLDTRHARSYGFIAQEVAEVFPDLVDQDDSTLGLPYARFGVLAIAGIQELRKEKNAEVKSLRSELDTVKSENKRLSQELSNVLQRLQALESLVK